MTWGQHGDDMETTLRTTQGHQQQFCIKPTDILVFLSAVGSVLCAKEAVPANSLHCNV